MTTVMELLELLQRVGDDMPVAVVEGDNYDNKKYILSPYVSQDGEFVIQFWN